MIRRRKPDFRLPRMNPIEIQTTLTATDWRAYLAAWTQQLQAKRSPAWQSLLSWLVTALAFGISMAYAEEWRSLALGAAIPVAALWLQGWRMRRQAVPDKDG